MYQHNDGISLLDTELPDGLHKSSGWIDCPPDVTDDQGNCLVITYLRFAEGQYWGRRIYFPANDGNAIYVNNCSIGVWQGWERIPTDVPPQVFDLPLSDGWTAHRASEYFKTQENIVTVYFQVHTSSPQGGEIILATLPEGFRPPNTIGGSGYCGITGEKYAPADVKVYPNGDITGFNDVGAAEYYTGFFTFVAAS